MRDCGLLALACSLLASKQVKDLVQELAGQRYRDGLYRSVYNVQAMAFLVGATQWVLRLPDREH